jgi:uncharacterized protein YigE (DUF2233 family)
MPNVAKETNNCKNIKLLICFFNVTRTPFKIYAKSNMGTKYNPLSSLRNER